MDIFTLSDYTWAFGQFLDHDIGLTLDGEEPAFIPIPRGDIHFDPFSTRLFQQGGGENH